MRSRPLNRAGAPRGTRGAVGTFVTVIGVALVLAVVGPWWWLMPSFRAQEAGSAAGQAGQAAQPSTVLRAPAASTLSAAPSRAEAQGKDASVGSAVVAQAPVGVVPGAGAASVRGGGWSQPEPLTATPITAIAGPLGAVASPGVSPRSALIFTMDSMARTEAAARRGGPAGEITVRTR